MGFSLTDNPGAKQVFIICIVTGPLVILSGLLRFIAARLIHRKQSGEDWMAYFGIIVHLVYISMTLDALAYIDGRPFTELTLNELTYIGKLYYAVPPLFVIQQLFTKLSVVLFYRRIFGVSQVWNVWIWIMAILTVMWTIAVLPIFFFMCKPISKGWNFLEPGTCISYSASVAGAESVNSGIDFMLAGLAVFMIKPLHISTANKVKLSLILAVAGLAGVIGIIKIVETYQFSEEAIRYRTGLWAIVQMACSIICCCAPTFKPVLPSKDFFQKYILSSFSSSSRSRSSQQPGSSPTEKNSADYSSSGSSGLRNKSSDSGSQNWLRGEDGSAWAEVRSNGRLNSSDEEDMQAINVHRSVQVA